MSGSKERFDAAYYARYYEDEQSQVVSPPELARLSRFVCSYLDYLQVPVARVLDMGCGLGWWRPIIAQVWPHARYQGVEISRHLCDRFGWQHASVDAYRGRGRFDLVICQGVLQYLDRRSAAAGIENLARLCRGALYLEVLTREDWEDNCDQSRTDGDVHLRPATFYRSALHDHFVAVGGGLYLHREAPVTLYELERLE